MSWAELARQAVVATGPEPAVRGSYGPAVAWQPEPVMSASRVGSVRSTESRRPSVVALAAALLAQR